MQIQTTKHYTFAVTTLKKIYNSGRKIQTKTQADM